MAARKSTTKARPGRNSARSPATEKPASKSAGKTAKTTLKATVETERRRLQRAHSVLSCIAVAMDYDDWTPREISYSDAIDVAGALVADVVDRLDSVNFHSRTRE